MKETICQCCFVNIANKNVNTDHFRFEQKVGYSDFIKDLFNINISSEIHQICSQCLKKLDEALEFKNMIMNTQEELKKLIYDSPKTPLMNDKIEESTKIVDTTWDIDEKSVISNTEQIIALNLISNGRNMKKKRIKEISRKELKQKSTNSKAGIISKLSENRTKIQKAVCEDSMKLLKYSNMCLFKSLKTKFQCYLCKETFFNMSDLRSHTDTHCKQDERKFKINLKDYSSKNADISSLSCKLCQQACNDLKILKQHLENKHGVQFNSNDHIFVPYKLESGFKCALCSENFNTFVRLSIHMNGHSTNNVCEICGLLFISRLSLRTHLQSMHKEKKCTLCTAKFEKTYAKTKHMRTVHNIGSIKRYCTLCGKDFRYSYLLAEHRIKEHGVQRQIANCKDCNKTFLSMRNLQIHIRSVHIKERNFSCSVCDMGFFTRTGQKRHERKHDDVKLFSCAHCEGRFKSKESWKRHLKRKHEKLNV